MRKLGSMLVGPLLFAMVVDMANAIELADADQIFQKRVMPILRSNEGSSCRDCHFSGVELRDYIQEDQAKTFASLRQSGLIDVDHPGNSKILTFISRRPEKPKPLSEKVRAQELEAFTAWIEAAVKNPELLRAEATERVGTELAPEVIRHARRDRVVSSFIDNIWSEMGRCVNCHSPEKNRDKIAKHGKERVDELSWIVPGDPAATLARLDRDGLIDLSDPKSSPVLTKPAGLEDHEGGKKFVAGGPEYEKFLAFLTDYAAVRNGTYRAAQDLPTPPESLILMTRQQLRINNLPDSVGQGPLRVDLYRWQDDAARWSPNRVGVAMNVVNGKQHAFQSSVSVVVDSKSPRLVELRKNPQFAGGKYLAKVFLVQTPFSISSADEGANHSEHKTAKDTNTRRRDKHEHDAVNATPQASENLIGEIVFEGPWPEGYQPPKTVLFNSK